MLLISFKLPGESIIRHKEWHVGESNPIPYNEFNSIINIQADGHELNYIITQYCINPQSFPSDRKYTIPIVSEVRVMLWFDNIAKTIVANL